LIFAVTPKRNTAPDTGAIDEMPDLIAQITGEPRGVLHTADPVKLQG
jgi:hypothetical protein